MLQISQIKIPSSEGEKSIYTAVAKLLSIPVSDILKLEIRKESIDARKKPQIFLIFTVIVEIKNENGVLKRVRKNKALSAQVVPFESVSYQFPNAGTKKISSGPVIVGSGPAGLFCAYYLALHGAKPILLERGRDVDQRTADVERFWENGTFTDNSNVQFGEGGAGTFSDGKLATMVKDKDGRGREVLSRFVAFGADPSILYDYKPHIGTDVLKTVVKNMRNRIIELGGEVRFEQQVTDIKIKNNHISGVIVNGCEELNTEICVLAIGHSARDTFRMLYDRGLPMEQKAFAVGFRVEHPQKQINLSQYGEEMVPGLGAAPYKLTAHASNGRNVFSFCMCPGGYVVNASSEQNRLAVNGMSYSGRDGVNANSAIIVSVTPNDYDGNHPLAGIAFQEKLEEKAYAIGSGRIPVQRLGLYRECIKQGIREKELLEKLHACKDENGCVTGVSDAPEGLPLVMPSVKGQFSYEDLSDLLPRELSEAFTEVFPVFSKQIRDYDRPDATLLGIESRTSSPVRIKREENLQICLSGEDSGIYPCGEGAGYAGGITSAAMDGMKVAEKIYSTFCFS